MMYMMRPVPPKSKQAAEPLTRTEEVQIAGEAQCDPRTVRRALRGDLVRPLTLDRIRAVLAKRGLLHKLKTSRG